MSINGINLTKKMRKLLIDIDYDFNKFVNAITKNDIKRDNHFRPQYVWIKKFRYSSIGRFEHFKEDLSHILNETGNSALIDKLEHKNKSNRKNIEYYVSDADIFNKIVSLYECDFNIKTEYSKKHNDYI